MRVLGFRFVFVDGNTAKIAEVMEKVGVPRHASMEEEATDYDSFAGAVFTAGDSWVELWPEGPDMPEGSMLQIVVDDADAYAATAEQNGLEVQGPMRMHGDRVYFVQSDAGMPITIQSSDSS